MKRKENKKAIIKNNRKHYKKKPVPEFKKKQEGRSSKDNSGSKQEIVYRSSKTLLFYKWILPIIGILVVMSGINELINSPYLAREKWANGAPLVILWIVLLFIILMFRLRKVRIYSNGIYFKKFWKYKELSYDDIEWVSQTVLTKVCLVRMKYRRKNGRVKRIYTIPEISLKNQNALLLSEDEMTIYIRKRIIQLKPGYNKSVEPKRWMPFVWIISIPIITLILAKLNGFEWLIDILLNK